MSKPRGSTFQQHPEYEPTGDFNLVELEPWTRVIMKGIGFGILFFILNILGLLLLNVFYFGGFLDIISEILMFEAAFFWFLSGSVIWFGPSPSVARFKSRLFRRSVKPEPTSISLRKGLVRFVIGLVLFLFS